MDTRPIQQVPTADQPERVLIEAISISELVEQLSGFVRRQFPIFVFILAGAIGLGLLYLFTTPARYTAHAVMVIDSSKLRILQQQSGPNTLGDIPVDTAQVETQVEILKSDNIGLAVIKDQRLTEDSEFVGARGGIISAIFGIVSRVFSSPEPTSEFALARRALGTFKQGRAITRVGRTYVLDIAFTSLNPGRAATIANAIADSYITDQLEAKYQATRRASAWLQDRIKELRAQAAVADRAVLEYKEKNNIVDIGGTNLTGTGSGARLLGDQSISELNTQLSNARSATAEAKARLDRITDVMKQDLPDAAVADSLHDEVINRLRNQYLDLSAREAIWSTRYGKDHLATVNLRTQMNELRRSIFDELGRIAESYKSDYEIAKTRQETLEQSLAKQVLETQVTNRDRLGLRDLESSAQVYHTIYDNFLQRYMEAIQQQSFPITEARVISPASPPSTKSSPHGFVVLAIASSLGLILSFAAATLREAVDRVFRTTRQVEEVLQTNCLAVLPMLKSSAPKAPGVQSSQSNKTARERAERERKIFAGRDREFLRHVVDEPLSSFAEGFRSIKVAADIAGAIKDNRVIGVTSTVPREGKSTVSSNLAELIAHAGKRVILLDGDLRNPTLTRSLAPDAKGGLLEVLAQKADLRQVAYTDDLTKLTFLPAVVESRLAHTNEILASDALKRLIEVLRQSYDYIVIDLPPLAPVVDVRATTHIVDSYLFVVAWGETRMNVVQHQLAGSPEVFERLLGIVLNKANINVLERYEYYYGKYYYKKYYSRYGYAS